MGENKVANLPQPNRELRQEKRTCSSSFSTRNQKEAPYRARVFRDLGLFFRIGLEFLKGFHFLRGTQRAITIFGSARLPIDHPHCVNARLVASRLTQQGFAIITGGGPSIMKAANQGAFEAGGHSIGINIEIPREQQINPFVHRGLKSRYFFVRKVLLCRYSEAFVIFPGGFGTLDEFFEIVTLIQTKKMIDRPIVLVGREFWSGFLAWCRTTLLTQGMINEQELDRLKVVDSPEEVLAYLQSSGLIRI